MAGAEGEGTATFSVDLGGGGNGSDVVPAVWDDDEILGTSGGRATEEAGGKLHP